MWENHSFEVEYEYSNIARGTAGERHANAARLWIWANAPHILFTPCLRSPLPGALPGKGDASSKGPGFLRFYHDKGKNMPLFREYFGHYFHCGNGVLAAFGRLRRAGAALFITLCRCAGIPARWQSGLWLGRIILAPHDWAEGSCRAFWLAVLLLFGCGAHRGEMRGRRRFYFGGMDPLPYGGNTAIFMRTSSSPSQGFRQTPMIIRAEK